jgi:SNF2 family DNA or RNA helicase
MHQLKRDLQVIVKSGQPITAVNEAAARTKFIQISLGEIYDAAHNAHHIDVKPRLTELRQVIAEAPGKLLCFVLLTSVINMLYAELHKEISCAVVNGQTSTRDRERAFGSFQQSDHPRLLIADPGTMAHGLDLWRAQTVVWFGPTDRTELYLQANARAYRPGQKYPVTIVQFVSNTLEKEIFRRLDNSERMQGLLLQMVREGKL